MRGAIVLYINKLERKGRSTGEVCALVELVISSGKFLFETCAFACALAQIIQLRPVNVGMALDDDFFKPG